MERPAAKVEIEGKGVDYERFALNKLFNKFVRVYPIKRVLEIPAKGEKAMPSLYSIAFGAAGCEVDLVNAEEKSKKAWQELGLTVGYQQCEDLTHTGMESEKYDLVWNFMYLSKHDQKEAYLKEMVRLSRRYILFIGVNRFNPGFFSHRLVHRVFNVPWNHGDVDFMNPFYVSRYLKDSGLNIVKAGVVDTPPFPDSLGIRDMKLHRKNTDLNKIDWHSRTIQWMKNGQYPLKIRFYYLFEILPLPFRVKLFYAHLFYVLAEK
jgi:hypothetical protein